MFCYQIWMHTCFHLLLFIAVVAHSSEIGNPITDDIEKISILKQNIPKDYKITVKFIPMEEDDTMLEFQCHYREEKWPTGEYFEFVEYFFKMANSSRENEDCESPPCPTVEVTTTTSYATKAGSVSPPSAGAGKLKDKEKIPWVLPENIEKSLLSLLLIPVIAILLLFAWKIKSRRHVESNDVTEGVDGSSPQLETEALEEKTCLNINEKTEEV
ncbi:kit ligand a isoform X5 [Sardina pilchardus]|uniref:kit ligand a isoform X5 n=1 Tax=Sardina pilchardus TaxID=27697 RepID=UPI002E0E0CD8